MKKEIQGWHSPSLGKHMEIVSYGHFGFNLLLIPTAAADYLEYERFLLIDALEPLIKAGKLKVFSINSINTESWLNKEMHPPHKAIRQNQFNNYVHNEVIPYIKNHSGSDSPIYTCGASFGALHSMNLFLKRPDLIDGVIAMSGCYDLSVYTDDFFDQQVYFNSPQHYVPNLTDHHTLEQIRKGNIHIMTGSGNYERPAASRSFSDILKGKGIGHNLDIWGHDMPHDWPTWRAMLPYVVAHKL
ncbi:MAG: esterase family protein [Saprospiraceae bacterium]